MWLDPTKTTSKDLIPLQARALVGHCGDILTPRLDLLTWLTVTYLNPPSTAFRIGLWTLKSGMTRNIINSSRWAPLSVSHYSFVLFRFVLFFVVVCLVYAPSRAGTHHYHAYAHAQVCSARTAASATRWRLEEEAGDDVIFSCNILCLKLCKGYDKYSLPCLLGILLLTRSLHAVQ